MHIQHYLLHINICRLYMWRVPFERSFSTLKYLKNGMENSIKNEHLELLMTMAIEKEIIFWLDIDATIKTNGEKS